MGFRGVPARALHRPYGVAIPLDGRREPRRGRAPARRSDRAGEFPGECVRRGAGPILRRTDSLPNRASGIELRRCLCNALPRVAGSESTAHLPSRCRRRAHARYRGIVRARREDRQCGVDRLAGGVGIPAGIRDTHGERRTSRAGRSQRRVFGVSHFWWTGGRRAGSCRARLVAGAPRSGVSPHDLAAGIGPISSQSRRGAAL